MPGVVYLRVNRRLLLLPNPPNENQPNPASSPPLDGTGNLNVIAGPLLDIGNFAGTTVDWLICVAKAAKLQEEQVFYTRFRPGRFNTG